MKKTVECPICTDVYNTNTRLPKMLTCGHGVCKSCGQSLMTAADEPSITCPECRSPCYIPGGETGNLPTNYPLLRLVDTLCSECVDRPHTQRCAHCSLNLCDGCKEAHQQRLAYDTTYGLSELNKLMEHLQYMIDDDKDLRDIKDRGNHVIDDLTKVHEEQIRKLEDEHKQRVANVQYEIRQNTDVLLDWRASVVKLLAESRIFLDEERHRMQQEPTTDSEREKHTKQKVEALQEITADKPELSDILSSVQDVDLSMSQYRLLLCSVHSQTDDMICTMQPDYTAVTHKATYDHHLQCPQAVCSDPSSGNLVVADHDLHQVLIFTDSLQLVRRFGVSEREAGEYNSPWGVAVYDGHIYVTVCGKHRIHVTDCEGTQLSMFGSKGSSPQQLCYPRGLAFDSRGLLHIADSGNMRVKVTDRQGLCLREFGQDVFVGGDQPWFISVSRGDNIAVSTLHGNIHLFNTRGQHMTTIKKLEHNIDATGVAYDTHGQLLVSDDDGGRVVVLTEAGEVAGVIPNDGPGRQVHDPRGLALTATGDIFVCDKGNKRVHIWNVPYK